MVALEFAMTCFFQPKIAPKACDATTRYQLQKMTQLKVEVWRDLSKPGAKSRCADARALKVGRVARTSNVRLALKTSDLDSCWKTKRKQN